LYFQAHPHARRRPPQKDDDPLALTRPLHGRSRLPDGESGTG
jgi:hypothetical protein